jgi:hypothetical protein
MAGDSSKYNWSSASDIGIDYELIKKEGIESDSYPSIHSNVYTNISHVLVLPFPILVSVSNHQSLLTSHIP